MSVIDALLLGLLQGLTEFLPVSSSGHIELGKALLGVDAESNLTFTVVVHGATVLSTIVVFRKELASIGRGLLEFRWNESYQTALNIIISMIPVGIVGVFFKDHVATLFGNNLALTGTALCVTAILLAVSHLAKHTTKSVSPKSAFIIGLAQAVAVVPGISRSGSTIVTALLLGVKREEASRFSFLMVILPIIAANALDIMDSSSSLSSVDILPMLLGFITAFVVGVVACRWMVRIVNRGTLIYFAAYCLLAGLAAIIAATI